MAEILLSLTIIGVVAAITLPSLTGNINERTWNTQRKALYARFSQAIALMPALNGYGADNLDTAAETFVTAGLSKVLKINNICDSEHFADCGVPDKVIGISGSVMFAPLPGTITDLQPKFSDSIANVKAAAFETANGESIVAYYNPQCQASNFVNNGSYKMYSHICANFVYDLNGNKGPNTLGKDIGYITALYPSDSVVVAPYVYNNKYWVEQSKDFEYVTKYCNENEGGGRLPNIDELQAMHYNEQLLYPGGSGATLWSATPTGSGDNMFGIYTVAGVLVGSLSKSTGRAYYHCVKRK